MSVTTPEERSTASILPNSIQGCRDPEEEEGTAAGGGGAAAAAAAAAAAGFRRGTTACMELPISACSDAE